MPAISPVTLALIVGNTVVFFLMQTFPDTMVPLFALWPFGPSVVAPVGAGMQFQPWQMITYAFMHGSLTHLLVNMFALYMFGGQLEGVWGRRRYFNFYLICIVTAAAAQLLVVNATGGHYPTVGASGAVFGLLLAYAMYFPNRTVMLIIPPIPMPAWLFVTLYGLLELYLGVTGSQAGVAHFAHIGGMLGGFLMIQHWRGRFPFRRRRR